MLSSFLWFVGGAITYKVFSKLLRIGYTTLLIKEMQSNLLSLIICALEDLYYTRSLKYKQMVKSELSEKEISSMKNRDELEFSKWKERTIRKLRSSMPLHLEASFPYSNWEEAMAYLELYHKASLNEKNHKN